MAQNAKVLIVEDQQVLGDNVQEYLRPRGWDTRLVRTGSKAVAALASFHPNILLLDYHLPDMTGPEVLDAIGVRQECGCILMTAHPADTVAESAKRHGIVNILYKPFSLDEMERSLRAALAEYGQSRDQEPGNRV